MARSISNFMWDRAGYAELMDSDAVQALVKSRADAVLESCNSTYVPNEGETEPGYVEKEFSGRLTHGYVVRTNGAHAAASERVHNRLISSL